MKRCTQSKSNGNGNDQKWERYDEKKRNYLNHMCSIEFASGPHAWLHARMFNALAECIPFEFVHFCWFVVYQGYTRHARRDASWFAAIFDTSTFSSKSHSVNLILLRMMFYGAKGIYTSAWARDFWDKEVHVKYWTGEKQFFVFFLLLLLIYLKQTGVCWMVGRLHRCKFEQLNIEQLSVAGRPVLTHTSQCVESGSGH